MCVLDTISLIGCIRLLFIFITNILFLHQHTETSIRPIRYQFLNIVYNFWQKINSLSISAWFWEGVQREMQIPDEWTDKSTSLNPRVPSPTEKVLTTFMLFGHYSAGLLLLLPHFVNFIQILWQSSAQPEQSCSSF